MGLLVIEPQGDCSGILSNPDALTQGTFFPADTDEERPAFRAVVFREHVEIQAGQAKPGCDQSLRQVGDVRRYGHVLCLFSKRWD